MCGDVEYWEFVLDICLDCGFGTRVSDWGWLLLPLTTLSDDKYVDIVPINELSTESVGRNCDDAGAKEGVSDGGLIVDINGMTGRAVVVYDRLWRYGGGGEPDGVLDLLFCSGIELRRSL